MIVFVMGPACGGKSTFIKKNFPTYRKIDLYDFEIENGFSVEAIMQSYEECKNALIEAIKKDENVVLEHTLLKAIRREVYIKAVKEITDAPIVAYFICPSDEELKLNAKKRMVSFWENELSNMREIMEIPTTEEGFSEVHFIDKNLYTEFEIDSILKTQFIELYNEVFDNNHMLKNDSKSLHRKLIVIAMQVEAQKNKYFGDDNLGIMNIDHIQELYRKII